MVFNTAFVTFKSVLLGIDRMSDRVTMLSLEVSLERGKDLAGFRYRFV